MSPNQLTRALMAVAVVSIAVPAVAGSQLVNCPQADPNVDCWSPDDGWCPDHCNAACTIEER